MIYVWMSQSRSKIYNILSYYLKMVYIIIYVSIFDLKQNDTYFIKSNLQYQLKYKVYWSVYVFKQRP